MKLTRRLTNEDMSRREYVRRPTMNDDNSRSSESALFHLDSETGASEGDRDLGELATENRLESAGIGLPELNDAEADNIAFIVSDRISRSSALRMMNDDSLQESGMAELAERVGKRLNELSLRLGGTAQ
jgi:hypothetical protein